ncbi:MAG: S9 family peptidase [Burkholderiaceae bacterium]|nr:S9 family peptidase [Burkholderiaceae bacterium]
MNRALALFLVALLTFNVRSHAQQPLSVEEFVRPPAYASPTLSPSGKHFAVTVPINGRMNLAVVDLETRKGVALTNFKDYDVIEVDWVGDERLLFTLGQFNSPTGPGRFDGGGLFMVSRDGKESRKLFSTVRDLRSQNQFVYRYLSFARAIPGSADEVIAVGNLRDAESLDVYRLNVVSGRAILLTEDRPARTVRWVLDRNRVARVAVSYVKDTLTTVVHYRRDERAPFEELLRYDAAKPGAFVPLYFEADNKTLLIATNADRETMAVYRYDPDSRKQLGLIAEHPKFDMGAAADGSRRGVGGVVTDPVTDEVIGYSVEGEKPEVVWLSESMHRLQRMVDGALPNTHNSIRRTRGDLYLVTSYSDRQPTAWYLLDERKKTLEELFSSRPWLTHDRLVEMRPFYLKTRDGLEVLSYYFLPADYKRGQKLPTVVHVHGGPMARADYWGRFTFGVREAQLLASRGYAVVLPNFRITPGLGNRTYFAGFGAFGRQMLEDHEDAARWAVAQGFADPERICISGASYGGYATLMSLARFPKTFKCGVAGLVVSDVELLLTSPAGDIPSNPEGVEFWKRIIGVARVSDIPREISPVNLADRIKQPVLFYAGADDIRTPLEQTTRMVRALERGGNPPKAVIIKPEEGHGYGRIENNVDLYNQILKFLDETIGGKRGG